MTRGTILSVEEKAKIIAYKDAGLSNREIARRLKRSHKLVDSFLKLGDSYNEKRYRGGNPKISRKEKSLIIRLTRTKHLTAGQIKAELQLNIGKRRIQQILSTSGCVKWTKRQKRPVLTKNHKSKRLEFAEKHMLWQDEWKSVIFSDEKKFNLDGPDGFQCYWHDLRKEKEIFKGRNFGGGTVMIWAAFCYYGKSPICWITTKMNSEKYIDLLDNVLINFSAEIPTENWIFQHDNAAVHRSETTKTWFQSQNINILDWPARSPDLNPIENLWGILAREVYKNGQQYEDVTALKRAITAAWSNIPDSTIQTLALSMKKIIFEVIKQKGGNTKY